MKVEAFFFIFCLANLFMLRMLWVLVKANEARLERLERSKPVPVVKAPSPQVAQQTRQIEERKTEGFNPKTVKVVLPRTDEQIKARATTDWEIESDFNIVG